MELAIRRSGKEDVVLPLMVAASVGGAEIFPTLLQWILLHYAQEEKQREAL